MPGSQLHVNGVNGLTGESLLPTLAIEDLVDAILQAEAATPDPVRNRLRKQFDLKSEGKLGVRFGFTTEDPTNVGWGVIYHPNTPQQVKGALVDLVDLRHGRGPYTYVPGESAYQFRLRHGQDFGPVDPDKLPYYLLIVGSPVDIPYDFQYDLDTEHAVGRLHFDTVAEYERYAKHVVAYETAKANARPRRVAFFSPAHVQDVMIQQSADSLAKPLFDRFRERAIRTHNGSQVTYQVEHSYGDTATQAVLLDLLTRSTNQLALLFSATHGLAFDSGQPRQRQEQGALLCQEWPGKQAWPARPIPGNMYVSGKNIPEDSDLSGLIVFAFACFSAGTPKLNTFAQFHGGAAQLANEPLTAHLSQRMLTQGALAFIGHVDQVWSYSFAYPGGGFLTGTFEDALTMLLGGYPAGFALERFNQRYLDANNALTSQAGVLNLYKNYNASAEDVVHIWTARHDARAYVLFGDPAVRLRLE